jgi:hypothetical protein
LKKKFSVPNGVIDSSILLAVALRYFSGGSKDDLCPLYGIRYAAADRAVKFVVDAINDCPQLKIEYSCDHVRQLQIAQEFKHKSQTNIDICTGVVDSMLLWTSMPSINDCILLNFEPKKFFCGRKNKFGLNMMGTADASCWFLDVDISHPAATSDHLVFVTSTFYHRLTNQINGWQYLANGFCLFGDNAYVNTDFMCTPYNGNKTDQQDNYNFYCLQLRIRIKMAFGMLVRRFGILHHQMHPSLPLSDIIAMTMAMKQIHNFCIDKRETKKFVSPHT